MSRSREFLGLAALLIIAFTAAVTLLTPRPPPSTPADGSIDPLGDIPKWYGDLSSQGFRSVRLVVSASMGAETDPCGCAPGRPGGLARRATAYARLRSHPGDLPAVFIDGGDSLFPEYSRRVAALMPLYQAKADVLWEALARLGVTAAGLGANDLVADFKSRRFLGHEEERALLATNLRHGETTNPPPKVRMFQPRPDCAVAVISLFDDATLRAKGLNRLGFSVVDPVETVRGLADQLNKAALVVLINHMTDRETARAAIAACDSLRIVIDSGLLIENPRGGRMTLGRAVVIRPPELGTHVTFVDCFLRAAPGGADEPAALDAIPELDRMIAHAPRGSSEGLRRELELQRAKDWDRAKNARFAYRLVEVPLGSAVPQDPAVAAAVARFKAGAGPLAQGAEKSETLYQTAEQCGTCHKDQYERWSKTRHFRAFETLVAEKSDTIRECVSCHVTGFLAPGGPDSFEKAVPFRGVQCMSCHVPPERGRHPDDYKFPKVTSATCLECHTRGNSPKFDFEAYLPRGTCCTPLPGPKR